MPRTHRKRGSALTSGMTSGSRGRGDAAGDALAERHPRPADLEAVEAVGRGERQVRSVAVEQVERGDVRVEHVAGPVDDGLEQLVPRPRGRREARDLVQEAELLELVGAARRRPRWARPDPGRRRIGRWIGRSSRPSPYKRRERSSAGKVAAAVAARGAERSRRSAAA